MNNFFDNLKFKQLGLILIASLAANLFSKTARAETPNCVAKYINKRADIDSATYAFGNYTKTSYNRCELAGGEGTEVSFNLSETLKMIHIKKISYPNTDVEIFVINDVFDTTMQARNVPPWVSKYLFAFKEESKRVAPKFFAEFELSATLQQKRLDEENAAKAREQAAKYKTEKDKQQAQTTADLTQLRQDLAKMNAGQLFAKADELSSQGDTAKARETLRMLISKFPDHPLVGPAAQQMATMSAASANASPANSGGNNNSPPAQSGQALGALITTGDACGSNGQKVVDAIISRYERFRDPEVQGIVQGLKQTTLAENVRNMLSIGGGRQGAINGVAGEVKNNQQSMVNAAEGYCKIQAGCNNYASLGWPDNMNTSLPTNRGGASGSLALAYVLTSVMNDLNSVTLRALRCTP